MGINQLIATLRRRTARQEGFSLIEVTMAIGVLFIALLALARTATVAFSDVSFGRQRQVGNQLANQLLEEVRALPYDTIKNGLSSTDLTGDSNIVNCSGTYRYVSCTGEKIIHSPGLTSVSPLVPHTGTFGPPDYTNTYAWRTYVTEATGVPSKGAYRVMVVVDWNPTSRGGARTEVNLQTLVFSPQGCIDTATHPFGAPCQAYFYGTGSVGGGTYQVSGQFFTEPYDAMNASLVGQSSDIQAEQISRVEGDTKLLSVSKTVSGTETLSSSSTATAADTDPASGATTYETGAVGPQAAGDQEVQSGGDRMNVTSGSGSVGASTSTVAAGGANACNLQIDGLACGYASATQSAALSHTYNLIQIGTGTIFSVGTSATPVTTYARRYKPLTTDDGLVRETVSWNLPEIRIGGIPSTITPPTNWAGYWVRLTGFTATATVESGLSTAAPTISITGGTVEAWNGDGYDSTAVTTAGGEIAIDSVDEQTTGSNKKRVEISGTVGVDASSTNEVLGSPATTRTEADATIGSPLTVEMSYTLSYDGNVEADLDVLFTAGMAELTANYTAA
ncbi:MAG: type IV pilus modification PilV family protein [Actinomycetota bacterium]